MAICTLTNPKTGKKYQYHRKWVLLDMETHTKLKTLSKEQRKPMSKIIFELLQ